MSNLDLPAIEVPFNQDIANGFLANRGGAGGLHRFLGIKITSAGPGTMTGELSVREELLTPFGNMHGGVLSAFCDHMLGCVCYPGHAARSMGRDDGVQDHPHGTGEQGNCDRFGPNPQHHAYA